MPSTTTPTSATRRPKHHPSESEREIVEAAEEFLRERPFRELSVKEVMARTGLKRPAFYAHFTDRYDLVLRVVQTIGAELDAMADRWFRRDEDDPDPRSALEGIVSVYRDHGTVLRAISDAAATDARVEVAYRSLVEGFIDATARHIRAEQSKGRIRPLPHVDETARALIWMEERYLIEALGRRPFVDPEVVTDVLHDIWMHTLYGR